MFSTAKSSSRNLTKLSSQFKVFSSSTINPNKPWILENFVMSTFDPARDTNDFVHCISQQFATAEPHSLAIGLTKSDLELIVYHFLTCCPDTAKLSVVIRDKKTGKLAGCAGNEDIHSNSEDGFVKLAPKWAISTSIMEKACEFEDFQLIKNCKRGETMHTFFGGTMKEFAGFRFAYPTILYSLAVAANMGYKYSITEPTHHATQKAYQKIGFELKSNVLFDTFEFNGERPLRGVPGGLPIAMHKDISVFKAEL